MGLENLFILLFTSHKNNLKIFKLIFQQTISQSSTLSNIIRNNFFFSKISLT